MASLDSNRRTRAVDPEKNWHSEIGCYATLFPGCALVPHMQFIPPTLVNDEREEIDKEGKLIRTYMKEVQFEGAAIVALKEITIRGCEVPTHLPSAYIVLGRVKLTPWCLREMSITFRRKSRDLVRWPSVQDLLKCVCCASKTASDDTTQYFSVAQMLTSVASIVPADGKGPGMPALSNRMVPRLICMPCWEETVIPSPVGNTNPSLRNMTVYDFIDDAVLPHYQRWDQFTVTGLQTAVSNDMGNQLMQMVDPGSSPRIVDNIEGSEFVVWKLGKCKHDSCEVRGAEVTNSNGRPGLKQCAGCRQVGYCSKEHQLADWPVHKKKCKELQGRFRIPQKDA